MNVLALISYKVFPAQMGGQKGIAQFYEYLAKQDNVIIVAAKNNQLSDIPFPKKYNCLFPQGKGILNILKLFFVIKLIRRENIDVIVIEHSYWGWYGYLLHVLTKKPFIIHSHNIEAERFNIQKRKYWKIYELYEKWAHQRCSHNFFKCEEDAAYAVKQWNINPSKVTIIRYGTDVQSSPTAAEKQAARSQLIQQVNLPASACLLLFNGTLNYAPNVEVLTEITGSIIPILRKNKFNFSLIICGKMLPEEWLQKLTQYPEIHFLGFVENIAAINAGVDALIQPGSMGTGIKTKLVEALAQNTTVITTHNGARGIPQKIAQSKLILIPDYNPVAFAEKILQFNNSIDNIPNSFYHEFYWGNIAKQTHAVLENLHGTKH
ncbi:MAG: glycosyltransferase [Sphingobacteriales bacterium]|uniref:glycosyltransferase family 4 protein n=1 Tax=Hydrotalea flava TaxID=714549 RepID=UPI00082B6F6B|nr:glycosyltransferase family 4 protein [Hydrotalea flava]RTL52010.1 MAG: glycosyltransferase [Sphingobacteriales bacterium]